LSDGVTEVNGKAYVGSAVNLKNRVNDYFQPHYYKSNRYIIKALNAHGMDNFELYI